MQVSALNLIIAGQQARSAAPPRAVPAKPQEAARSPAFDQPDQPSWPTAPAMAPLGSQIDIRV